MDRPKISHSFSELWLTTSLDRTRVRDKLILWHRLTRSKI